MTTGVPVAIGTPAIGFGTQADWRRERWQAKPAHAPIAVADARLSSVGTTSSER